MEIALTPEIFLGSVGAPQHHWVHAISVKQTNKKKQKVDVNFMYMYNLLNNVQVSPLPAKRGLFKKKLYDQLALLGNTCGVGPHIVTSKNDYCGGV